jgi:hypothetical protein
MDLEADDTPDLLLDSWHRDLINILDKAAPIKNYPMRKRRVPWVTSEARRLMFERDSVARRRKKDPCSKQLGRELAEIKRRIKSKIRRSAKDYGSELLSKQDHKGAWKYIKAVTFSSRKGAEPLDDLRAVNDHFANVVTSTSQLPLTRIQGCDVEEAFTLRPITAKETMKLLNEVNVNTATGPDEIPGFLIKLLSSAMAPNLTNILNNSMQQGCFPSMWKKANVCPIWKNKGCRKDPGNYRPISILPVLARIFEKYVASQLYNYCDLKGIIPIEQFGFRRSSSCELAVLSAMDGWRKAIDDGEVVGALLIDLSKAFDTVPHQLLLEELSVIGCDSTAQQWFHSYLDGRAQRVVQQATLTEWKDISRGVPQGSCLSPLLFNIFIRGLPKAVQSNTIQFADDVTHSEHDKDPKKVVQRLTDSFNRTKQYCDEHELKINADKTQLIVFKSPSKKIPEDFELILDNIQVKREITVKLLGVTLDHHLTLGSHIDKTVKKCHGLLGMLYRAAPFLPRDLLRMTYTALIRSQLEFASAVFTNAADTHLRKLDTVQKMASRTICGAARNAHSAPLLELLKLESLESRRCNHIGSIVKSIIDEKCHPAFHRYFELHEDGAVGSVCSARTNCGKKQFKIFGAACYNALNRSSTALSTP